MRVLIIDDSKANVMLLERLAAKMAQVETVSFLDPAEALAWCRTDLPDLVLVDYMMPGMDGLDFVRHFRAAEVARDIPIVMVTAANERDVRQRALDLGTTDFLGKPVDPHELLARMTNLLALRRSQLLLSNRAAWLAEEVRRATIDLVAREEELIMRLSRAAEYRDPETGAHLLRMSHYSALIGRTLGLDGEACHRLLHAAPMHDIGKVGIPDGILLKPGRLDQTEFAIMMEHAAIGHSILKDSSSELIQLAAEIALSHHEKFDGTGYPRRLAGTAIPLMGRIVAVADVFDALTSERPYKSPWPVEKARGLLEQERGVHFDPVCVDAFLSVWNEVLAVRQRFTDAPAAENHLP